MRTNESAFTPQRKQSFGGLIILIMFLAFVAWLFLRACTNTAPLLPSVSAPTVLATVPATPQAQANAQPAPPVATPELHQICLNGICVKVPGCKEIGQLPGMALNDGCADMTPAQPKGNGTGFSTHHYEKYGDEVNATVNRANPPDGWKYASDCPPGQRAWAGTDGNGVTTVFCK